MVFICDQCGGMFDTEKALVQCHINPFHLLPEIMSSVKRNEVQQEGSNVSLDNGDQNSLFKSFAEQLQLNNISTLDHDKLRVLVVDILKETPQILVNDRGYDLSMFINESSWESYLLRMGKAQIDGDHLVLQRLCEMYNVRVEIIIESRPRIIIEPSNGKDLACIVTLALDSSNNFISIPPVCTRNKDSSPLTKTENIPYDVQDIQATLELRDTAETEAVTVLTSLGFERNSKDVSQVKVDNRNQKQPKKNPKKQKRSLPLDTSHEYTSKKRKITQKKRGSLKKSLCFQSDKETPFYKQTNSKSMTANDIINLLLQDQEVTCSKRPMNCQQNAVFILKLSDRIPFGSIHLDNMEWSELEKRKYSVKYNSDGEAVLYAEAIRRQKSHDLTLIRIYRKNTSTESYRCIISYCLKNDSIMNDFVIVQYYFIGTPSPVVGNNGAFTDFQNKNSLRNNETRNQKDPENKHIEPKADLFKDDEAMPYFRKGNSRGMTALDIVKILLDKHQVTCIKRPFSCKENAVFLVTLSSTCLFEDVTFDDMSWLSSGRRTSGLVLNKDGDLFKCIKVLPKNSNTDFTLTRMYRKNSSNENFRCIISYVKEHNQNAILNSLVMIQYYFIGPPSVFTIRPHGNSKTVASFKPTKTSTKRLLKELLQVKPPSEAIRQVRRIIKGDVDRRDANCDLPLGKQQAYDMNRRKRQQANTKV